ncbi:hypothetical protein F2Q69_00007267 [Brassica cretica]|uniref:START domain-containing protein n=1 Tax=Brassica cretica TaxID=69181 RepID=A0A8S9PFI2_BRACR|nr:hypothetical protein F2Q69_00007267 [Brassica cretica]
MAMTVAVANRHESGDNINRHLDSSGKYVRYTAEQVEALERVYSECPKPTSLRRQQLIRECSFLANIEPKQIKPGPDSVGIFAISQKCNGVAARACGLVSLEPMKIVEILKDRPSWFRDCRSLEVFTMFPSGNGGTIELIYMQTYAPTTLAPARDFWTLRYTTSLENGSFVVCERSLSGSGAGPNATSAAQFAKAEMLPSGYLIRPCDGGCSIIHIVDHINFEGWSVPDVLRPLYESSKVVAQRMTIAALRYVRQVAHETNGEVVYGLGRQPAVLRTFSQRLSRGFNDAVNGFNDDGWSIMHCNGAEDITVAVNSTKHLNSFSDPLSFLGGVLCAKASMLLHNVCPAVLIRFLREHRSEWADFNVDAYSAATLKAGAFAYSRMRPTTFTGSQIIMPLGNTIEKEEMLEVVRLEGHSLVPEDSFLTRDVHLLQICTGIDEDAVGACSELVFAPVNEMFPDDAPLVPSGFRVIPVDAKTVGDAQDLLTANHQTLDLTSSQDVGSTPETGSNPSTQCILTIAFQFPFENNLQENVANMACQYVRSVISSVQRVAVALSPSVLIPIPGSKLSPGSPEAVSLAIWICHSYKQHFGSDLLRTDSLGGDALLRQLWDHQDAILCCSLKPQPVFMFANQAGLDMLETTLVALQGITLEKIFDESGRKALCPDFAKLMQQGFACLPSGMCVSTIGRHVSYEQAVSWKVFSDCEVNNNNRIHCLAFLFANWSFL